MFPAQAAARVRVLLLFIAFVAAACRPEARTRPLVVRIALVGPLGPVDPESKEETPSIIAQAWIFEGVARFDTEGRAVAALAERLSWAAPNRVRIQLRRGVTFTDGSPLTLEDVERALARVGLDVSRTVDGDLMAESRSRARPIDEDLVRALVFRRSGDVAIGTGPFEVVEHTPQRMRLRRRLPTSGRINEVLLLAFPGERDTAVRTLSGETNLLLDPDPRSLEFFEDVPTLKVVRGPGLHVDAVAFNPDLPRGERVAFARALARGNVREWAFGEACRAGGGQAPDVVPPGPGRKVLSLPRYERFGRAIRRALGARGGDLEFVNPRFYFARLASQDFDVTPVHLLAWPPRLAVLRWRTGTPDNALGYSNPRVDAAIDVGDLAAAERALAEDPPIAPVCRRERVIVVDARIANPRVGPFDLLETLPDWEVAR